MCEAFRLVSMSMFGPGYLPALVPGRRTLDDTWADTQVVHVAER